MYMRRPYYRLYRFIHKQQRYENDVASEMQKMRKKVTVQMKVEAINRQD